MVWRLSSVGLALVLRGASPEASARESAHARFVTWALEYPRCHWVELQWLGRHYERAEFEARRSAGPHSIWPSTRGNARWW